MTDGWTSARPVALITTHGHACKQSAVSAWMARRCTSPGKRGSTTSGATSSPSAAAAGTGSRSTSRMARTSRSRSVRNADGTYPLVYGTYVETDGSVSHLAQGAFTVTRTGAWTSSSSAATYPAGWHITIPGQQLSIDLTPTVADQELDTRATTGVIYWEGSQHVSASRNRQSAGRRGVCRAHRLRTERIAT